MKRFAVAGLICVSCIMPVAHAKITACTQAANCVWTSEDNMAEDMYYKSNWGGNCDFTPASGTDFQDYEGIGICAGPTLATLFSAIDQPGNMVWGTNRKGTTSNSHCYCKLVMPVETKWIYYGWIQAGGGEPNSDEAECHKLCTSECASMFEAESYVFRNAIIR